MVKNKGTGIDRMKKLGFGMMRLPVIDGDEAKVDLPKTIEMVDYMLENGFTYFDTAYVYHRETSEIAMREALIKRHARESFKIANKMPVWRVKETADYEILFTEQLERCGVEYFDYYMLHALGEEREDENIRLGAWDYLFKLREDGRAKKVGFSFHDTPEVLARMLDAHPEVDFVQIQINYIDWMGQRAKDLYEAANERGVPIIVMEPVKGGTLANLGTEAEEIFGSVDSAASPSSFAIRFCASLPGVFMVLSGMSTLEQVKDNAGYMKDFKPLTNSEEKAIWDVVDTLAKQSVVPCTSCKYCIDCPQEIEIPTIFGCVNDVARFNMLGRAQFYYNNNMPREKLADKCVECGACEEHCPQRIPIIEELKKAHKLLTEGYVDA